MSTFAKLWAEQFIDEDGAPFGLCYAQFFDSTGMARKAVWTDRAKTLPSTPGTLADIDGDIEGWITVYGDGVYKIVVRAAGDDGTNAPIRIFENVQLQDAEPAYEGATSPWDLAGFEERELSGQGRQAVATSAQSSTTLQLSRFDVAGSTYLVQGTVSLLTFQKISVEDYLDGARITVCCLTNPFKLRAKRDGEGAGYNVQIGTDFLMSVGSSIDLELRDGEWWERSRFFFDASYENLENTGLASGSTVVAPGRALRISGTATINNIYWVLTGQTAPPGQRLDLYFEAGAVVGDATGNIDLEGTFTGQAGATLSLISIGAAGWREITRTGYVAPNVTQTLGTGATPSVAGTYDVYYTGENFDDVQRLTSPGTLGRIILLVFNGTLTSDPPTMTYTACRKTIKHKASASEGYISLKPGVDFGTLPGDFLRLQLLLDGSDVLYWQELDRHQVDFAPRVDGSSGTITWWRPSHTLYNATGGNVDVTQILPVPTPHNFVTFHFGGGDKYTFDDTVAGANFSMYGKGMGLDITGEVFTFISVSSATGPTGSFRWQQIDAGGSGD